MPQVTCRSPSDAPAKLRTHPGFIAIGEEHQRMHGMARLLLLAAHAGNRIAPLDFDNFSNALDRLRLELASLERELENSLHNHDALTGAITRFDTLPTLRVSASFGLALLDPDLPVRASIDRADKALYAAKAAGRNCVRIWDPSL